MNREDCRVGMMVRAIKDDVSPKDFLKGDVGTVARISNEIARVDFYGHRGIVNIEEEIEPTSIEKGDIVKLREDLTLKELFNSEVTFRKPMLDIVKTGAEGKVVGVHEHSDLTSLSIEGNGWFWDIKWFDIVKKKPKELNKLYFDARKVYHSTRLLSLYGAYVKNHGNLKKDMAYSWVQDPVFSECFVEEEPEPLHIVSGRVK